MLRKTSAKGRQGLRKVAMLALCATVLVGARAVVAADTQGSSTATKVASQDPKPPKVENCAIVTVSTPVSYACGGKVYTSYQLQQLREKAEHVSSK
jgi:hypothetical protein